MKNTPTSADLSKDDLVRIAQKLVPSFKWAIGAAGLFALAAIIVNWGFNLATIFLVAGVLLVFAMAFIALNWIQRLPTAKTSLMASFLAWSLLSTLVISLFLILSSVTIDLPWPLRTWVWESLHQKRSQAIGERKGSEPSVPTPLPKPITPVPVRSTAEITDALYKDLVDHANQSLPPDQRLSNLINLAETQVALNKVEALDSTVKEADNVLATAKQEAQHQYGGIPAAAASAMRQQDWNNLSAQRYELLAIAGRQKTALHSTEKSFPEQALFNVAIATGLAKRHDVEVAIPIMSEMVKTGYPCARGYDCFDRLIFVGRISDAEKLIASTPLMLRSRIELPFIRLLFKDGYPQEIENAYNTFTSSGGLRLPDDQISCAFLMAAEQSDLQLRASAFNVAEAKLGKAPSPAMILGDVALAYARVGDIDKAEKKLVAINPDTTMRTTACGEIIEEFASQGRTEDADHFLNLNIKVGTWGIDTCLESMAVGLAKNGNLARAAGTLGLIGNPTVRCRATATVLRVGQRR